MKTTRHFLGFTTAILVAALLLPSFLNEAGPSYKFAYKQAGLTEQQAAAHLLNRFSYGPKAGDIDEVVKLGLEKWFEQQLEANQPNQILNTKLNSYDAINLSNAEVVSKYPQGGLVRRMAEKEGIMIRDTSAEGKRDSRVKLQAYMQQKGFKPQQELFRQFISQKILRAAYTENQLQEVLTDFWFNHFNVSLNKNQCAEFIPAYERDVIRPNVLGKFEVLLLATAKSPAMLTYLDNFSSMGTNEEMPQSMTEQAIRRMQSLSSSRPADTANKARVQKAKSSRGLNENYAREIMELHTLGVDGGYTQNDVTPAARVLTGWTINPAIRAYGNQMQKPAKRGAKAVLAQKGFVQDGDFLFAANRHDTKEKVVLGWKFAAGRGYDEGVELLTMLARHPSTAKFISRKIAVRFVSDNPPQKLVDRMARSFSETKGDIKQVLITMVASPEFWAKEALHEKTKSPFELAISAVRGLNAEIVMPYQLYTWITKMGQKMYYYQAPTGFPDRGQYWINTGSLLNRMNFGLALASQRIPGIRFNLASLNRNREPESAEAALLVYSKIIMPERNLDETIKRLTLMLNDPNLSTKVQEAASRENPKTEMNSGMMNEDAQIMDETQSTLAAQKQKKAKNGLGSIQSSPGNNTMLAQVVGVIIGSPEFQRK